MDYHTEVQRIVDEALDNDDYEVKDSGERQHFESGMQRDVTEGKVRWDLTADGPMLKRYAIHLTKGAAKYSPRNWLKANGTEELERFRESAFRHFMQWYYGYTDEDHAAAVWFNIDGAEYVRDRIANDVRDDVLRDRVREDYE